MTRHRAQHGRPAALLLALVWLAVCATGASAEPIPLWNGTTIDREVVSASEKGLTIKTKYGNVRLRWDQIDRSFRLHPLHGQELEYESEGAGVAAEGETVVVPRQRVPGNRAGGALLLLLVWFWSGVVGCLLVSRESLRGGAKRDWLNFCGFVFGLPFALAVLVRKKGFAGLLRGAPVGVPMAGRHAPPCHFYTWDNVAISAKSNRKLSSGLAVAEILMARAVQLNASDVHFDTSSSGVRVTMRVDGVLRDPDMLETDIGRKALSAVKMCAGMDLAKRHEAQDGACHLQAGSDRYDLRVASAWAVEGETLVVRLLRAGGLGTDLSEFGMGKEMTTAAEQLTRETAGIVILAGPTGSGKTTTIYGLLRKIEGTGRNILTIEDPVEYRLENATQISLNAKAGSTFATALKASMRHDPDVILVGEIRDEEAMTVAFQAALTGHLVFTTIHATSVLAALGRLHELGLSAYMINTGLKAIICQRLIRRLCPSCREPYMPEAWELQTFDLAAGGTEGEHLFYRAKGCPLCEDSGYHGRTGIYRMLNMDNRVRTMVKPDMNMGELQDVVDRVAMGDIPGYARSLLWTGVTSTEELMKTLDMFDYGKALGSGTEQ